MEGWGGLVYGTSACTTSESWSSYSSDAATDFAYDGRSFLTRAIERSYENLLTDGFEFGHTGCWTLLEGGVLGPQGPECFQQVTRPTYSSEGVLHALLKTNGPATTSESHYLLYFAGRPVLQLAVDAQGGSTYGYLTTDHLGTPAALGFTSPDAVQHSVGSGCTSPDDLQHGVGSGCTSPDDLRQSAGSRRRSSSRGRSTPARAEDA